MTRISKTVRCRYLTLIALIALAPIACIGDNVKPPRLLLEDHPLVDKIWSIQDEKFVDTTYLVEQARRSDYVLLGETHDNPLHHRHQGEILAALAKQSKKVSIVLEMLTDTQAAKLANNTPESPARFFDIIDWDASGWPPRNDYEPLFSVVLRAKLPLYAGNLDRKMLRALISQGQGALPAGLRNYIDANPFSREVLDDMREEIMESHCGMLPEDMADGMTLGQRTRDALMAKALIEHRGSGIGGLIAGSGHTRNDHGVPTYLRSQEPDARVLAMAWMEVKQDVDDPREYVAAWGSNVLPFDYVWFTPRIDRPDPCAELKAHHMKRKT